MNYFEACELLDRVRHGYLAPAWLINEALKMTGDLDDEDHRDSDLLFSKAYASMPCSSSFENAKRK